MKKENVQVVKINKSFFEYFKNMTNFDNESFEFKKSTEEEFKKELTKAINCGHGIKEIEWVD